MEPDYKFRSYEEYLPENYKAMFNEYWLYREHSMKELLEFLNKVYVASSEDKGNYSNVAEAFYACCEFFFNGEYGGMDEPGNNEEEAFLARYREGLYKIINTTRTIMNVAKGTQKETELRDINQLWKYLGWNIEDQRKIIT